MKSFDAIFVGGGASGIAGAIMLKRQCPNASIMIVEKQARIGKKLLVTGNGTCNLSNKHISPDHYHSENKLFPDFVLTAFPPEHSKLFFESIGVFCEVRENGRIYPECASAGSVLDCFLNELEERNILVKTNTTVQNIEKKNDGYCVVTDENSYFTSHIVISTGGAASPKVGGCTDGYKLLERLGHKKTPIFPSIVQLKTETDFVKAIKGLRIDARVSAVIGDEVLSQSEGEILFTEYGLSGPAVMQVSREFGNWERKKNDTAYVILDLIPNTTKAQLKEKIELRCKMFSKRKLEDFLTGIFQKRIGQTIMRVANAKPFDRFCDTLTDSELDNIVDTIKEWRFKVKATQGIDNAQVTAGGIVTDDFDTITLESKKCPHLYATGEVLDVDGDCGGYNLHWAWASACAVASAIGKDLAK